MKAVRTKSGKYRARYVDHYEYVDGKRKIVLGSVTKDTEWEALSAAKKLELRGQKNEDLEVGDALVIYINLKEEVLSPSTIRSYKALAENAYGSIARLRLSALTNAIVQAWVSKYAATHSPKATANAHGLLRAAVGMFYPDAHFRVTLPSRTPPQLYTPTESDVQKLLEVSHDKPIMHRAVILGAYGLRRGEACALTYADIDAKQNLVHVNKDIVQNKDYEWIEKQPKTPQSIRTIMIAPEATRALLKDAGAPDDRVVPITPQAVSCAFKHLLKDAGLPDFRFHDLRSFSASLQHAIGVPDQFIMLSHGWKSDTVLKQVYRRTMSDYEQKYDKKVQKRMSTVLKKGNKVVTNIPKSRKFVRNLGSTSEISETKKPQKINKKRESS